jgi:hypothetical protein
MWTPRSSSLGGYFLCDQRAAFDRAIAEGLLPEPPKEPAPYADLGTCMHYALQKRVGAHFPDGNHEPTGEQRATAATLFAGDKDKLEMQVALTAALAAANMPAAPDGKPWLAESAFKMRGLTGHIDFLSQDGTQIGDLKTTSRKPDHARIKADHIWQLIAYYHLVKARRKVEPQKAWILYVDSLKAQWALLLWFDFTTEASKELIDHAAAYVKYLRSKRLYKEARPRLGSHCAGSFCPHTASCRDKYIPPAGVPVEAPKAITAPPVVQPLFRT